MNVLFLMDPLETVVMSKDTTFILMLGCHRKGHRVFYVPDGGLTHENGRVRFHVTEVTPQLEEGQPFQIQGKTTMDQDDVDAVFIRNDPPFDQQYLFNTWILDHLPDTIPVINTPNGIRSTNEKVWASRFADLLPPTLIGRRLDDFLAFLSAHQDIVAKPTDGHGGKSVFRLQAGDRNTNVIFETLTDHFQHDIILQKFVPESEEGDKRIILLNGEPLGAVLRLHSDTDHRNNFFSGGQPQPAKITDKDLSVISSIREELLNRGLYFVGIDVIGRYLIEVNVTSPTCLQEINRFQNTHLEERVVTFLEELVYQRKGQTS